MELSEQVGISAACRALSLSRAGYYRARQGGSETTGSEAVALQRHHRALSDEQKQRILDVCASERFIDCSPGHIVAALLDEGEYIASERTFYRVLGEDAPLTDRRRQRRHPVYAAPQLVASGPNQVWSWDITKLKGPAPGACYHLYVILDIYSRYVVGWSVFERESEELARLLIETTCQRQDITPGSLTLHADRGPAMRSGGVAELLSRLEVTKSHSRPYCSNDNPYSESQFKTLKYSSAFPDRFGSIEDARVFCREFFRWYNQEHRHSGIAMLTPAQVHHTQSETILRHRDRVLAEAYRRHPERFVKGQPTARRLAEMVWINRPDGVSTAASSSETSAEQRDGSAEQPPVVNSQRREARTYT